MRSDIDETNRALELNKFAIWKGQAQRAPRLRFPAAYLGLQIQLMRFVKLSVALALAPYHLQIGSGLLTHRSLNAAGGFNKAFVPKFKHQQGPKQLAVVGDATFMLVF